MRVLALDLGSKRIGVAVSDPTGTLASPYDVVLRSGDRRLDHQRIAALVTETGAARVVVGLPYSLDGSIGPAARAVLAEVDELRTRLRDEVGDLAVETFDERLTTVTAHQRLAERGVDSKQRRAIVDQAAAAVLLQTWLESPARRAAERERAEERGDEP
jgi:putative Holliday junction resolvase